MAIEQPSRRAAIMGLPISLEDCAQVLDKMAEVIERGEPGHYISITNTESMYHGLRIASHGRYIREADLSLCDGVGVIVAGWAWGERIRRLNGPVLQLEASRFGVARKWRHFFYGGKEGVAQEMARRLVKRYPGLVVCGCYTPPFGELTAEDDQRVVDLINAAQPDIVWQERWIQQHLGRVRAPWMIGVGAAFDYHAGTVPWAPQPLRALGLEWLFRLMVQPRLRAKRYWWSLVFVFEALLKGLAGLRFARPAASRPT
jgi:N-acetylglucosaminyldiphosphoundecaprenol N-acetyl-beta-D-mannosaminyltransferase